MGMQELCGAMVTCLGRPHRSFLSLPWKAQVSYSFLALDRLTCFRRHQVLTDAHFRGPRGGTILFRGRRH